MRDRRKITFNREFFDNSVITRFSNGDTVVFNPYGVDGEGQCMAEIYDAEIRPEWFKNAPEEVRDVMLEDVG
jgi:hypothetical protein